MSDILSSIARAEEMNPPQRTAQAVRRAVVGEIGQSRRIVAIPSAPVTRTVPIHKPREESPCFSTAFACGVRRFNIRKSHNVSFCGSILLIE
jgi:hypothetical protein